MKKFWFIRHGESEGNAGLPSSSAHDIPLTEKGRQQAEHIADYIQEKPDLFVTSPYLRTPQTFEPTRKKFPDVPHQVWPVQEYTYLPPEYYHQTTTGQRRQASTDYFKKGDPDYSIGDGGESLNQFRRRVQDSIQTLQTRSEAFTIVFGHGWFMRCILWELFIAPNKSKREKKAFLDTLKQTMPIDPFPFWLTRHFGKTEGKRTMMKFLLFSGAIRIPNASLLKFHISPAENLVLDDYVHSHIPASLHGKYFIDR